ncbi:MAG: hypothetical protein R3C13_03980 [Hyphomonas sp.]|uniref:hypothetical protein n=1 Tax=Hyphomonas sp. TaxID=87 RepID=UPI0035270EB7
MYVRYDNTDPAHAFEGFTYFGLGATVGGNDCAGLFRLADGAVDPDSLVYFDRAACPADVVVTFENDRPVMSLRGPNGRTGDARALTPTPPAVTGAIPMPDSWDKIVAQYTQN